MNAIHINEEAVSVTCHICNEFQAFNLNMWETHVRQCGSPKSLKSQLIARVEKRIGPHYFLIGMLGLFLGGCAHTQKTVELQCISPAIREDITGPVIIKDESLIFYDNKGKLRKIVGVCGVKGD